MKGYWLMRVALLIGVGSLPTSAHSQTSLERYRYCLQMEQTFRAVFPKSKCASPIGREAMWLVGHAVGIPDTPVGHYAICMRDFLYRGRPDAAEGFCSIPRWADEYWQLWHNREYVSCVERLAAEGGTYTETSPICIKKLGLVLAGQEP